MSCVRNTLVVVAALGACFPTSDRFSTAAQPAFLGAASGIYEVTGNTGLPVPSGSRFFALEIRGELVLMAQDLGGGGVNFAFVGPLVRDAVGGGAATGAVTVLSSGGNGPSTISTPATVTLGLDELTLVGQNSTSPGLPPYLSCLTTAAGCGFSLLKICDFDPAIAGIYSVKVAALGDNGQCSTHASLAGGRQWALATINASTSGIVLSTTASGLEFGALLNVDQQSRALSDVLDLPLSTDANVDGALTFSGTLDFTSEEVKVVASDLSRTFPDGCVQHYSATGTRQQGATFATACLPQTSVGCLEDYSSCVLPPDLVWSEVQGFSFLLTPGNQNSNGEPLGACPHNTCATVIAAQQLCDGPSRQVAAGGCLYGATPHGVVMSAVSTGNDHACLELACDSGNECTLAEEQGGGLPMSQFVDYCPSNATVSFYQSNGCTFAICQSTDPGCPAPGVSCQDFAIGDSIQVPSQDGGCFTEGCQLEYGGSNGPQFDQAAISLLASGAYVVSGLAANGLPNIVAPPANQGGSPAQGCGSPIDVLHTNYDCPSQGSVNPQTEACVTLGHPPAFADSGTLDLAVYRQIGNGNSAVCLGYWSPPASQLLSIAQGSDCTNKILCCLSPGAGPGLPGLGCAADPQGSSPSPSPLSVSLVGTSAGSGSFTISGLGYSSGNQTQSDANSVTCNFSGSGIVGNCALPFPIIAGGYGLQFSQPNSDGCFFASSSDYATASGASPRSLTLNNPLPAGPITINVTCP